MLEGRAQGVLACYQFVHVPSEDVALVLGSADVGVSTERSIQEFDLAHP